MVLGSTPAEIRMYLSKMQVLLNVYLKYLSTGTHVFGPMPGSECSKPGNGSDMIWVRSE